MIGAAAYAMHECISPFFSLENYASSGKRRMAQHRGAALPLHVLMRDHGTERIFGRDIGCPRQAAFYRKRIGFLPFNATSIADAQHVHDFLSGRLCR